MKVIVEMKLLEGNNEKIVAQTKRNIVQNTSFSNHISF